MKLLTKELERRLPTFDDFARAAGGKPHPNPVMLAKWFTPWDNWTWYAYAYDKDTGTFAGALFKGRQLQKGVFRLSDLSSVRGRGGLGVERDYSFDRNPKTLDELAREHDGRYGPSPLVAIKQMPNTPSRAASPMRLFEPDHNAILIAIHRYRNKGDNDLGLYLYNALKLTGDQAEIVTKNRKRIEKILAMGLTDVEFIIKSKHPTWRPKLQAARALLRINGL